LQLGVLVLRSADDELKLESKKIVFKSIDSIRPKIIDVIFSNISYLNKENYPLTFLLDRKEVDGILTYSFFSKNQDITRTIELNELYSRVEGVIDLQKEVPLTIYENLSFFEDGLVFLKLKITDHANNSVYFEADIIKDDILPEIVKIDADFITNTNFESYSLDLKINKPCKLAKFIFADTQNTLSFERNFDEVKNLDHSFSDFDLSKLKDGVVTLNVVLFDLSNNESKLYEFDLYKDTVIPKLNLDQENLILHNKKEITFTGLVIDNLHENIKVNYSKTHESGDVQDLDVLYDCSVFYSPCCSGNGYNYVTCEIDGLVEGNNKILIRAIDRVGNEDKKEISLSISTEPVDLKFHYGNRFVVNTAPSVIKGDAILNPIANVKTFVAVLRLVDSTQPLKYNKYAPIIDGDNFLIDLEKPISGSNLFLPLVEGEYLLTIFLKDDYGNSISKAQVIIIDSTAPQLEINNLSTSNRQPTITGKVVDKTKTDVLITINSNDYVATVVDGSWSAQITNTLPLGIQNVKVVAKDEANNRSEIESTVSINSTGGGSRFTALPAQEALPEQEQETVSESVVDETPVILDDSPNNLPAPSQSNTLQEPIENLEFIEDQVEQPQTTGGLTGFVGFANKPQGIVTIVLSIFSVVGVLGYLFVFKKR